LDVKYILSLLKGVKQDANGYKALCPAHDDKEASLSVAQGNDGRILLYCHAGCDVKDITTAIGIEVKDLFPQTSKTSKKEIECVYDYCDANGKLIYQAVRYKPKDFRQRQPDGKGGWIWNMKGVKPVPFKLPHVLSAIKNDEFIFIAEGEKDCNNLAALGLTATCNHGGAGKWRASHSKWFKAGAKVVVLPDNDEPGREHASKVARQLHDRGCKVKVIELPGLPPKGDVTDWLNSGGTKDKLLHLAADAPNWEPSGDSVVTSFNLTDMGNAKRLVARHGKDIKYCYLWGKWLVWSGTHWEIDKTAAIERMAKETVQSIYAEAADTADTKLRQEIAEHAKNSESKRAIKAMIDLAQSEPGVPVLPEQLDTDPWVINCMNATISLKNGVAREHARDDMITKIMPVTYNPEATCPTWQNFLDRIFDCNENLIDYVQRKVGYSLTGDTSEQVLSFLYGAGANGKSTFIDVIQSLLGDYGMQLDTDVLMAKDRNGIPNDIARLKGARFVAAVEAGEGRRLNEVLVKQLTGGDIITARFLHQEFFEFKPQFKIFLAANHKPVIKGNDYAIWRRIRLIPFNVTIPKGERDKQLANKLLQELPGILNWALIGCVKWQQHGLGEPDEVKLATQTYRDEMDILGDFISEVCIKQPFASVKVGELYKLFQTFCEENGEKNSLSRRKFSDELKKRGFENEQGTGGYYYWRGLGVKAEEINKKKYA
jgi:putative DNA primase/helicase